MGCNDLISATGYCTSILRNAIIKNIYQKNDYIVGFILKQLCGNLMFADEDKWIEKIIKGIEVDKVVFLQKAK